MESPTSNPPFEKLSVEQYERIRINREAALARRLSLQSDHGESEWKKVKKVHPFAAYAHASDVQGMPSMNGESISNSMNLPLEPYYAQHDEKPILAEGNGEKRLELKPSRQQMKVLKSIAMTESVFLTGSAGTGKSFLLQFAIRQLRSMYGSSTVFVTASTGLAACSIGGTTVHSFAGIGLGEDPKEVLVAKILSRKDARSRWQAASALVIDEISMIDAEMFEKLDFIGRKVRKKEKPFGGIQLVVTGDFFQLPPVSKGSTLKKFAFEAPCWPSCFHLQVELTEVFRQSEFEFVKLLNELRRGQCSAASQQRLLDCRRVPVSEDGIALTRLYPHKVDVSRENEQNLAMLGEVELVFNAMDVGKGEYARKQLDNSRAEKVLRLRRGAQVMLVKNLDPMLGLANGARGVVMGFCDPRDPGAAEFRRFKPDISSSGMWPVVRFALDGQDRIIGPDSWSIEEGGIEIAKRTQVPLTLAWALSVHKCQGMTLDRVETDLRRAFDYGMVYVALSRVRSLQGLNLIGFEPSKIKVHPKVTQFYQQLQGVQDEL